MNSKKINIIGYLIFLVAMVIAYFTLPTERLFPVLLVIAVLYGIIYAIIRKYYRKK